MEYALILLTSGKPKLKDMFFDLDTCMDAAAKIDGACVGLSELIKLMGKGI